MRFVRFRSWGNVRLGLLDGDEVIDLTKLDGELFKSFTELAVNAQLKGLDIEELVTKALEEDSERLDRRPYGKLDGTDDDERLIVPIDPPEVWGCGVTYKRSRTAREFETGIKGLYNFVYEAARPEVFFKATASRCVGPNDEIGIRGDSRWSVPEPELAFILGPGQKVVGFTAGNDVSARDLEGENPLYLPQAKIFEACCSLGPSIVTVGEVGPEPRLRVECEIFRAGERVFKGLTNTSQMKRSIEELRSHLCRCNPVPAGTVCLTGTGIVPPDDFSLDEGDVVEISIEKIGTLRNRVKRLRA